MDHNQLQTNRPKILLLEQEASLALVLKGLLEQESMEVYRVEHEGCLLEKIAEINPDLLLLDRLSSSDPTEPELGKLIRKNCMTPILFMLQSDCNEDINRAFGIEHTDYIKKPYSTAEICHRIRRLIPEKVNNPQYRIGSYLYYPDIRILKNKQFSVCLQHMEAQVLTLLCRRKGHMLTRSEIILQVWHSRDAASKDHSLNTVISNLRKYLSDDKTIEIKSINSQGIGIFVHCVQK